MKRNFTKSACTTFLIICSLGAFSQTLWDTLPWKTYADYKLQSLNKTCITTGVLYDRVFPVALMDEHTGLSTTEYTTPLTLQIIKLGKE